jgi:hypothetical protein
MSRYLLKAVDTYRVPNEAEMEVLHEELSNDPCFDLTGFSYKVKQIKVKGEVIEEYLVVQATKQFTAEKDPEDVFTVSYERG